MTDISVVHGQMDTTTQHRALASWRMAEVERTRVPTLADRLQGRISGDTVLAGWLDKSPLRIGLRALSPSGVDLIGCALSRSVFSSRTACVALALPRGEHSLPALIGAYLTAWRHRADVPGSVAVSTRRPSLRERVAALRIPIPGWPGHVK